MEPSGEPTGYVAKLRQELSDSLKGLEGEVPAEFITNQQQINENICKATEKLIERFGGEDFLQHTPEEVEYLKNLKKESQSS